MQKEQILETLQLQNDMNIIAAGKAWTSGITNKGRSINWMRCIHMEISEFIDSFPWKHWKDIAGKADIENAKMELVDALHFIHSEAVVVCINEDLDWVNQNGWLVEIIDREANRYIDSISSDSSISNTDAIEAGEEICKLCIPSLGNNTYVRNGRDIEYLYRTLFAAAATIGMTWEDLYKLYLSKNALNIFRQENGYQNGSYIKEWGIWDGYFEDNIVLVKVVESLSLNKNLSFKNIFNELTELYSHTKLIEEMI